ncbi:hypothetical protein S40293_05535 [Stachybotrys chartarum IBT 40293]|nr:hypothetical protein S40293_05535 [Stachybotrys chartarum IBT 40293]
MDELDDFDAMPDDGGMDTDFGALPIFDSTAYSSQLDGLPVQAPEAVMDEVPSSAHSKKSKRSKKDKKKKKRSKSKGGAASSDAVDGSDAPMAVDRDVIDEEEEPAEEPQDAEPLAMEQGTLAPATNSKKKRKLSDGADGKRRKKRRANKEAENAAEATASASLDDDKGEGPVAESPAFEDAQETLDQQSPSAARAGRSRNANHVLAEPDNATADADEMEVDTANEAAADPAHTEDVGLNHDNVGRDDIPIDRDYGNIALEAWNERREPQNELARVESAIQQEAAPNADMGDQSQYPEPDAGGYEASTLPQESGSKEEIPSSSKKARSTRAKKAKPTYYEQSPEPEGDAEDLPSPGAMSPRPRNRKKPASKGSRPKKAKVQKLSKSMRGASGDEAEDDEPQGRRNRMSGYTQGRFTDAELERIRKAVENFRSENDLTQQEVNEMIQAPGGTTAGDSHAQLWVGIFAECPDRHRQKVINITRKKFHNFVARGTWTPEQDAELTELTQVHGTKWSKIAGIINRHPEDVRDRYRNYIVCGDAQRKDAWNEDEEARLTNYVIEAMVYLEEMRQKEPNNVILQRTDEELIDWQSISEKMDRTRSRLQCITKWKSLNLKTHAKDKLESQDPQSTITFRLEKARRQIKDMPDEEKYRMLLAIAGSSAASEKKISWQKLLDKPFRAKWHRSTQMLLWKRLKETIPEYEKLPVKDCAQTLVDHYNRTGGELPDVVTGPFDNEEERAYVEGMSASGGASGTQPGNRPGSRGNKSSEFVEDSGPEDEPGEDQTAELDPEQNVVEQGPVANGNGVPEAMMQDVVDDITIDPALTAPMSAAKSSPAKPAPSGDYDFQGQPGLESALAGDAMADDNVEEQIRGQALAQDAEATEDEGNGEGPGIAASPSVMDDMEDLPAKLPSQAVGTE